MEEILWFFVDFIGRVDLTSDLEQRFLILLKIQPNISDLTLKSEILTHTV